jgi:anaerobic ribonucleoside-triphosphate reductase activating protein
MRYLKITSPDIENGKGCRVTLWIPGCNRNCPGCHTPWTHAYNQGEEFTSETFNELCRILGKPYISGLTVSGGDPLMQSDKILKELAVILERIRKRFPTKDIWIYTGYTLDEVLENKAQTEVLKLCDYAVVGPFIQELRDTTLAFRGSSNQEIININLNKFHF